jgi:fused signal recognition particle receptor
MSWFSKIAAVFTKKKIDASSLAELEDLLLTSDIGLETTEKIIESLRREKFDKEITDEELRSFLAKEVEEILAPSQKALEFDNKPHVILVVGVNGNGKTTTIGKLANKLRLEGKKVLIVAADTFRAAAVEQLQTWASRASVEIFTGVPNQDPASVVYGGVEKAQKEGFDIVLVDTAGRLQNKQNLMAELAKISNVAKKLIADAPHEVLLVLDATTGQNAISQVAEFSKAAGVSGLIVTKLDGTAKGGVVVALSAKFDIPIYAIGVGEKITDLESFDASSFAKRLVS